jgi:hypothetical protein
VSETVIDSVIATFHAGLEYGPAAAAAAAALAPWLPGTTVSELEAFAAGSVPGPLFTASAFVVKGTYVQISRATNSARPAKSPSVRTRTARTLRSAASWFPCGGRLHSNRHSAPACQPCHGRRSVHRQSRLCSARIWPN